MAHTHPEEQPTTKPQMQLQLTFNIETTFRTGFYSPISQIWVLNQA